MIHSVADVSQIQGYVYDFMNDHYNKTCTWNETEKRWNQDGEELKASDVLETIEDQLYQSHVQSLEKASKIKKLAKYTSPQQRQEQQEPKAPKGETRVDLGSGLDQFKEPTLANKTERPLNSRFPVQDVDQMIAEAEAEEEKLNYVPVSASRPTTSKTPFAFLSREERLARMKSER
jgi:hypothetical protein